MSTGSSSITREATIPYPSASGTPAEALTSRVWEEDEELWEDVIDAMLGWRSDPDRFVQEDQADEEIIDTALDFASDQMEAGVSAPASVIPTGGRIVFEWRDGASTVIVELIRCGVAQFHFFDGAEVVEQGVLIRDPRSRKLERADTGA